MPVAPSCSTSRRSSGRSGSASVFGVPSRHPARRSWRPTRPSRITAGPLAGVPVAAVLADSHAATYAHGIRTPGRIKATYGTGSSIMALSDGVSGSTRHGPGRNDRVADRHDGVSPSRATSSSTGARFAGWPSCSTAPRAIFTSSLANVTAPSDVIGRSRFLRPRRAVVGPAGARPDRRTSTSATGHAPTWPAPHSNRSPSRSRTSSRRS